MAYRNALIPTFLLLSLGACSFAEDSPPASHERSAATAHQASRSKTERAGGAGFGAIRSHDRGSPATWDDYVSRQASDDAKYLRELDHRYFGVLSFASEEEREYLLRSGFPTPDEWLEASRMTDAELQARADTGDPKAAGMLADRMSVRLDELVALGKEDPSAVTDADRVRVATMAVNYATQAMRQSAGPFGLYVEGMVKSSIYDSWEPMTAAMLESMRRGDPRTKRLFAQLHARHPEQDISAIYAAFLGMAPDRP